MTLLAVDSVFEHPQVVKERPRINDQSIPKVILGSFVQLFIATENEPDLAWVLFIQFNERKTHTYKRGGTSEVVSVVLRLFRW
jgi:hypothetical protein